MCDVKINDACEFVLNSYVVNLINGRLGSRYQRTLHEPRITQEHRRSYLAQMIDLTRTYCKEHDGVFLSGIALSLVQEQVSIEEYIQSVASTVNNAEMDKFNRFLVLMTYQKELRRKYYCYTLLSLLSFGEHKKKFCIKQNGVEVVLSAGYSSFSIFADAFCKHVFLNR